MKLAIIGATGRTGREVVERALSRSHRVTAIVRSGAGLECRTGLSLQLGNSLDPEFLSQVIPNQDAVISVLGRKMGGDRHLLEGAARAMVKASPKQGAPHYIVVSQGLLFPSHNPLVLILRRILARTVSDSRKMEAVIRGSNLPWTIVRPPRLTESSELRGYTALSEARPPGAAMSRADLATCLVDEAESRAHLRSVVGVA